LRIVATADLHGYLPEIPECDLLLIGGDVCPVWDHHVDFQKLWLKSDFSEWLRKVPAKKIVGIGGNHDFVFDKLPDFGHGLPWMYLHDTTGVITIGDEIIKVHGAPHTPRFGRWALMRPDPMLVEMWDKIPTDIDVLLSHGPMYGYADKVAGYSLTKHGWEEQTRVGSQTLRNRLDHIDFPNLKLFICGHIHEEYGEWPVNDQLTVYNVSHMDDEYKPVNDPVVIDWKKV
jgi:hypothetical protein